MAARTPTYWVIKRNGKYVSKITGRPLTSRRSDARTYSCKPAVGIDDKAVPVYTTIKRVRKPRSYVWAFKMALAGESVRRTAWEEGYYIRFLDNRHLAEFRPLAPVTTPNFTVADFSSKDWVSFMEEE